MSIKENRSLYISDCKLDSAKLRRKGYIKISFFYRNIIDKNWDTSTYLYSEE